MRHIKLFEDFFGNNLWADTTYPQRGVNMQGWNEEKLFVDYIQRMYDSNEFEKNTRQEDQLLNDIEQYLSQGDRDIKRHINLLKKLMKYKTLYPEMLDPGQSLQPFSMLFRGMTMQFDEVQKAIDSCDKVVKMANMKYLLLKGAKTTVTSRQDVGFISVSTDLQTATRFQQMDDDRWPIVAAAAYGKMHKKCIMNPDFINAINPMDESETWILGNQIEAQDIYLQVFDPKFYKHHMKRFPKYAELMERIWRMYDDVRIKEIK